MVQLLSNVKVLLLKCIVLVTDLYLSDSVVLVFKNIGFVNYDMECTSQTFHKSKHFLSVL